MTSMLALVMLLAPAPDPADPADPWAAWRWLGTADERVLWAILAGTVVLAVWGAWTGWRRQT